MSLDLHCHARSFAHTRWCQTQLDTLKQKENYQPW